MFTYYRTVKMPKRKRFTASQYYRRTKRARAMGRRAAARRVFRALRRNVYRRKYRRRSLAAIGRVPRTFPKAMKVRLTLCTDCNIGFSGSSAAAPQIIGLNCLTPLKNGGGGLTTMQACGVSQYSALYLNYCVMRTVVKINPIKFAKIADTNTDPNTSNQVFAEERNEYELLSVKLDDNVPTFSINPQKMIEERVPFKKIKMTNDYMSESVNSRRLIDTFDVYRDFGLKKKDQLFKINPTAAIYDTFTGDSSLTGNVYGKTYSGTNAQLATDPNRVKYMYITFASNIINNPAPTFQSVGVRLTIEQDIYFFNRKPLGSSTTNNTSIAI